MKKNGVEVIHFATGLVVGYPPCPRITDFISFIKVRYGMEVVVGTHPIPLKYFEQHEKLPFWKKMGMEKIAPLLFNNSKEEMKEYD